MGLVLAGLLVGTAGMHLIRTSELKKMSGLLLEGSEGMLKDGDLLS